MSSMIFGIACEVPETIDVLFDTGYCLTRAFTIKSLSN
jgi:hypothetical protein